MIGRPRRREAALNRRKFLKWAVAAAGVPAAGYAYARCEAHWLEVNHHTLSVPRLPSAFAGLTDLTNTGRWLERHGSRLRLAGLDDVWYGHPNFDAALGDTTDADACVLVCHNPDFMETLTDRRVGLVLSGHMHGGQIVIPG